MADTDHRDAEGDHNVDSVVYPVSLDSQKNKLLENTIYVNIGKPTVK